MGDIHYLDILKRALLMTWKDKFLWVFGLLILLSSLASQANANFSKISAKSGEFQFVANFIRNYPSISLAVATMTIVILLVFFLLRFVAIAALIKAANNIVVYRQYPISSIISEVKKYIWPLLLLEITISAALIVILILLAVPIAYLFALKARLLFLISVCIAFIIFIPLAVIAYYLRRFAYFYIVLGNMQIKMALEASYSLLRKNISKSLLMGIVAIVSGLAIVATALASMLILAVAMIPVGLLLYFIFAQAVVTIVSTIGVLVGMVILSALFSWYCAFAQIIWVLFFQEISLEKRRQEKNMAEKIQADMKIPSPEAI